LPLDGILEARTSLLAARLVLVGMGALPKAGALVQRVGHVSHHALYSVACSRRNFASVLALLQQLTPSDDDAMAGASSSATHGAWPVSLEARYVWIRFHLCALPTLERQAAAYHAHMVAAHSTKVDQALSIDTRFCCEPLLLSQWLRSLRLCSRDLASRLSDGSFPLDPATMLPTGSDQSALRTAWAIIGEHEERSPLAKASIAEQSSCAYGIWPLEQEQPEQTSQHLPRTVASGLSLGAPHELFHRKGEFVRAVCENALNPCQLVVALGRGVHQLEVSESMPTGDVPQDEMAAQVAVQQSITSDNFSARCLCAHTKLPLYLAGGDSVVQCWQFGQAYQGQALHDHLRAQYKLPAGGRVVNMRISPVCSEQFGSIDDDGFVSLWRFQSGGEMPLPFNRLQCHMKRGGDLCFVESSVLLASVGLS